MPEFMLSVHHDYLQPLVTEETDMEAMYAAVAALNADLQAAGAWVWAGGLQAPDTATVVSVEDEEITVTPGPRNPLAPTLGGLWVLELPDATAAARGFAAATSWAHVPSPSGCGSGRAHRRPARPADPRIVPKSADTVAG